MMSDPDGNPEKDAANPDSNDATAELKPKAKPRKKKAAEVAEALPVAIASEIVPEKAKAKPAKKVAAKKAKPAETAEAAAEEPAPSAQAAVEPEPDAAVAEKPTAKKAVRKKAKPAAEPAAEEPVASEDAVEEPAPVVAAAKGPAPKLERLQKILAKAGISSRRKAEELILGGRVQINGQVVMELGTKADPERDHVRVDGKLLQGAERIRYFVLNKPKGYVTTVSDPEGRPTVMQFFTGERERLYPVGRLDYLSEGLLLVTNDGELANKLTKASSGVEKTYLVKVAGQPTEDMLDALREGVVIERGRPGTGSGRVRTAPAKIRQVRQGDNPWYEVIIIEGRNRELRKMFEEIGHHVEKIRRVGYGPLILDQEPGKLRELEPEEVQLLRLASEGKLKSRRRRGPKEAQLPTVAGKTVRYKKADGKPGYEPRAPRDYTQEFSKEPKSDFRPAVNPSAARPAFKSEPRTEARPEFRASSQSGFRAGAKPAFKSAPRSGSRPGGRPELSGRGTFPAKPRRTEPPVTDYVLPPRKAGPVEPEIEDRPSRGGSDFNPDYKPGFRTGSKPAFRSDRPARPGKPFGATPAGPREDRKPFRPATSRTDAVRPAPPADDDDFVPRKTPGFRIEPVEDKPRSVRPPRPSVPSAGSGKPFRPRTDSPRPGGFAGGAKPFRPSGGDRPSQSRPYQPRTDRPAAGARPYRPRTDAPPAADRGSDRGFRPTRSDGPGRGFARPTGDAKPFRSRTDRPDSDRPRSDRPSTGAGARSSSGSRPFRPGGDARPGPGSRPARPFRSGDDRPREFRPRTGEPRSDRPSSGPAKKFGSARPSAGGRPGTGTSKSGPSKSGPAKTGPDGAPRDKGRWRDSYVGKNKGRPKPKPKSE
jgi:23S rRNA pseudouridine2605 synthase